MSMPQGGFARCRRMSFYTPYRPVMKHKAHDCAMMPQIPVDTGTAHMNRE